MGKHFLPTFLCKECNETKPRDQARLRNGIIKERLCKTCRYLKYSGMWARIRAQNQEEWKALKGTTCIKCGFTGEACQFDLNHIDGNRYNNDVTNLETLCANCHRLVTYQSEHFKNRYDSNKKRSHRVTTSSSNS